MHQIEHFELATPHAVAMKLRGGCVIRATRGRLWLTVQGHMEDVWLHAGEGWTLPATGTVWISAESTAQFQLSRAVRPWRWPRLGRLMPALPPGAAALLQAVPAYQAP